MSANDARPLRVAFAGASGTGKSTLARFVAERYGLEMNPVGSRSVAAAMGFASPYDVDAAGQRGAFQRRLQLEKATWEDERASFVTDRTFLDEMAYTMMHDVSAVTAAYYATAERGMARYTHVFVCPIDVFQKVGDDPHRKKDPTYHRLFECALDGLLQKSQRSIMLTLWRLYKSDQTWRQEMIATHLER